MEIETRVPLAKLVTTLRKELRSLEASRPAASKKYKADVAKWRGDVKTWIAKHASSRVDAIDESRLTGRRSYDGPFSSFFSGAPEPPTKPTHTDQIAKLKTLLRQLSIAQPKDVRVTTDWVRKYLGDGVEE
jgi:hypothetical protein